MKTIKFNKLILLVLSLGMLFSCVQDDDFDVPSSIGEEPELPAEESIVSISSVLNQAAQSEEQYTYQETNLFMEGYVVSSDEGGNFFRELILQDKPENPTAGIRLGLFVNPLYTKYEVGRKIYIGLDGFSVGTSNGVVTLGIPDGNFMDEAPAAFEEKIIRSAEVAEIVPLPIEIADFSDEYENIFVKVENVQFPADIVLGDNPLTFAGEDSDAFDGERTVESCDSDNEFVLSTSTFADFKSVTLPSESGSISGVLSRDFDDEFYVVSINDLSNINFDSERCGEEPEPEPIPGEVELPLFEDFEQENLGDVSIEGWINTNVNDGDRVFEVREFSNNRYAQTSAFNSDENPYEAWLVTPGVNLNGATSPVLSFETKDGYFAGEALSVHVSTNFTGDPNGENVVWTELTDAQFSTGNNDGYGDDFVPSGTLDLSDYIGETVYIGFKYEGGDGGVTTTYQIDNIEVVDE